MGASTETRAAHRRFLNRYYGAARHVYDATRKYYLFGRDEAIEHLLRTRWRSLVEVGVGTGRNLAKLRRARPHASLGGLDASDAMLDHARARYPWAKLSHGFAEDADLAAILREPPERILFSYSLSMIGDPVAALEHARQSLSPGGRVVVVDFGDFEGLPLNLGEPFRRWWLNAFHVEPLDYELVRRADHLEHGLGRYWFLAELAASD